MILFLPLVSLRAQPTAAIYNISGVVLDPSGSFVPGASVRLHQQSATIAQARTQKADGRFSFPDIPPGAYTVQVLEDEFELQEVAVLIEDSDPKPLSIVLVLRELQQALTVYDSDDEVNTSNPGNSSAVTLDLDTLEGIPVMDDDIIGAVTDLVENITGETARIVVDGMPASGSGISPAEIKEIKINKDPYSAEYSGPGSGRVEITTKGGSKSFHGSLGFGLRDYRMDARNAFALDRPTTQRRVYSGDFSGPLSKSGKTTFIATMWRKEEDQRPIVNALTLEGAVRENVPQRTESTTLSGKVRSALSDNNIISLQYRFVDWTAKGELVGGFSLPEAGADYLVRKHVLRYDHTTILSPNLVNRFTVSEVTSETIIQSLNPGVRKTVVLQAFTAGGSQVDGTHSTDNIGLSNVTSWEKGRHSAKAGFNVPTMDRHFSDNRGNFDGTYYFSSLADFELERPFAFNQNGGDSQLSFWHRELGWFVQDYIRLRPNLSVGLGLRHEWQSFVANDNNFAPRLSLAYSPGKGRATVIRAGAGIFYGSSGFLVARERGSAHRSGSRWH